MQKCFAKPTMFAAHDETPVFPVMTIKINLRRDISEVVESSVLVLQLL